MKKIIPFLILLVFLSSCNMEKNLLVKDFNKHQQALSYVHDTIRKPCERSKLIAVETFDKDTLEPLIVSHKVKAKMLPFLFYNKSSLLLSFVLGENTFSPEKYPDFLRKSFVQESQNLGCYKVENDNVDYRVVLSIDSCTTEAQYELVTEVIFGLLFYFMTVKEIPYPAMTFLQLNVKIYKGEELVYNHNYQVNREYYMQVVPYRYIKKQRAEFVGSLVNSLSYATKDILPIVIEDINKVVHGE